MAYIDKKFLDIVPSPSPDVAGYFVYLAPETTALDYDSETYDVGMQIEDIDLYALFGDINGNYNVGVAAYDDAANISDILEVAHAFPFDLQAPLPPAAATIS